MQLVVMIARDTNGYSVDLQAKAWKLIIFAIVSLVTFALSVVGRLKEIQQFASHQLF